MRCLAWAPCAWQPTHEQHTHSFASCSVLQTGYRTRSIMSVPMLDPNNKIIGTQALLRPAPPASKPATAAVVWLTHACCLLSRVLKRKAWAEVGIVAARFPFPGTDFVVPCAGVLQVLNKNPAYPRFDREDETLLKTFSAQVRLRGRSRSFFFLDLDSSLTPCVPRLLIWRSFVAIVLQCRPRSPCATRSSLRRRSLRCARVRYALSSPSLTCQTCAD